MTTRLNLSWHFAACRFAIVFLAIAAGTTPAADWPTERGGSASLGRADESLPAEPAVLWEYEVDGSAFDATPVIAGGVVFVCDADGETHAIDLATGERKWLHETDSGYLAAAAVQGDSVIVADFDGMVRCLDRESGQQRWQYETSAQIDAGATFYEGAALITSEDGNLYALELSDGSLRWKYETGDQLRCSAAVGDGVTFLGGCDSVLHVVDLKNGMAISSSLSLEAPTGSTPVQSGSLVIAPTHAGTVRAFDWRGEKLTWSLDDTSLTEEIRSSPAVGPELIYLTVRNKRVLALDPASGAVRWEHVLRKRSDSSPVYADGRVWVTTADGAAIALDAANGQEQWKQQFSGSFTASPAIADSRLVIASTKGVVYCLGQK